MRVAYICADPGVPVWGSKGASAHVRAVVRALRRRGAEVTLFTPRTGGSAPTDLRDVEVVPLPGSGTGGAAERERRAVQGNAALHAALAAHGPVDLVYERYSLWSFAGMVAARSRAGRVRSILEVNAPLVEEQARHRTLHHREAAEAVARWTLGQADSVVAVSEPVAAWARGRRRTGVTVVPNGVDVERFAAAAQAGRRRASAGAFTVAFVGTLKPWHGVAALVEAVRLLDRERGAVPTRLLLIGDGPERRAVEQQVEQAGLGRVTTMTGAVDPDEVPSLLAGADVGVAPYPADADAYFSPLKVLEYLAAGLPVVGSGVGQVPHLLDYGRAGVLTPPGDVAALAEALRWLRDAPQWRAQLGAHGRVLAEREHGWDGVVARSLATVGLDVPLQPSPGRRPAGVAGFTEVAGVAGVAAVDGVAGVAGTAEVAGIAGIAGQAG